MPKTRLGAEQIVAKLRQVEARQSQGKSGRPYVLQARARHLKRSPEGSAFPSGNIWDLGFGSEIEFSRPGHFR